MTDECTFFGKSGKMPGGSTCRNRRPGQHVRYVAPDCFGEIDPARRRAEITLLTQLPPPAVTNPMLANFAVISFDIKGTHFRYYARICRVLPKSSRLFQRVKFLRRIGETVRPSPGTGFVVEVSSIFHDRGLRAAAQPACSPRCLGDCNPCHYNLHPGLLMNRPSR